MANETGAGTVVGVRRAHELKWCCFEEAKVHEGNIQGMINGGGGGGGDGGGGCGGGGGGWMGGGGGGWW